MLCALGSGIVNSVSAEATGTITCMVTGHMQKLGNYASDLLAFSGSKPPSAAQTAGAVQSLRVLALFASGTACAALALGGGPSAAALMPGSVPVFSALGLAYAMALFLHDRPARREQRQAKKEATGVATSDAVELTEPCEIDAYGAECLVPGGSTLVEA